MRVSIAQVDWVGTEYVGEFVEDIDDPCAATRRAIVRAAAAQISHDDFVLMFPGRFHEEEVERARAASLTRQE